MVPWLKSSRHRPEPAGRSLEIGELSPARCVAGDPQQYATDYPHGPGEGAENPGGTGQGLVAQLTHRPICRSSSARLSKCLQITIVLLQHAMVINMLW